MKTLGARPRGLRAVHRPRARASAGEPRPARDLRPQRGRKEFRAPRPSLASLRHPRADGRRLPAPLRRLRIGAVCACPPARKSSSRGARANKGLVLGPGETRLDDDTLDRSSVASGPEEFRTFWGIDYAGSYRVAGKSSRAMGTSARAYSPQARARPTSGAAQAARRGGRGATSAARPEPFHQPSPRSPP